MKNPNTTNGGASNSSFKSQDKNAKIFWFLKAVPYIEITANGINSVSTRLGISPENLTILIAFVSEGGGYNGN